MNGKSHSAFTVVVGWTYSSYVVMERVSGPSIACLCDTYAAVIDQTGITSDARTSASGVTSRKLQLVHLNIDDATITNNCVQVLPRVNAFFMRCVALRYDASGYNFYFRECIILDVE